jgi:hypothetical protein
MEVDGSVSFAFFGVVGIPEIKLVVLDIEKHLFSHYG